MSQETQEEKALRPKNLANFIGQDHAKPNLEVYLRSAKARGAALDHVLICGPAGLGKTSLSEVIAHELGTRLVYVFAPSIKNVRDLIIILAGLQERDVLFIDEIHALDPTVEEILYPATEDQKLRFTSNNTPININLPSFTLIGATTRAGMLQKPMLDRFGITIEMQPYTDEQLATIIKNNAPKLGIQATDDGALELARR
jgi:Holliday junction DNA helicase RuvB